MGVWCQISVFSTPKRECLNFSPLRSRLKSGLKIQSLGGKATRAGSLRRFLTAGALSIQSAIPWLGGVSWKSGCRFLTPWVFNPECDPVAGRSQLEIGVQVFNTMGV
ncbi:unnamed protein product [Natator depressus]